MRTLIAFVLTLLIAPAIAQTDRQLVDRFDRADAARDHRAALVAARAVLERYPEAAAWYFNAARAHAMLGEADQAVACLERCAEFGYTGIASFEQHRDLDALRERDDFGAILERVRTNASARLEEFKRLAADHTPASHVPRQLQTERAEGPRPALLVALHGTGGSGAEMIRSLRAACDRLGVICVAPDALRPAGDGYSWTYRDESRWLVDKVVREAIAEHGTDPSRTILIGFSQGANIALAMACTDASPFTAMIPVCGHYEPDATAGPVKAIPMYLISGSRDPWHETFAQAESDFADAGAAVVNRVVPAMGHRMPNVQELIRALEWTLMQSDIGEEQTHTE